VSRVALGCVCICVRVEISIILDVLPQPPLHCIASKAATGEWRGVIEWPHDCVRVYVCVSVCVCVFIVCAVQSVRMFKCALQ
jgi:hypothetical protein